ncbi:interferon-induced protein 44-like [Betta splendens]|uniref:Interferon-induced protein 44-like n=1 Tax=Betta splendens TaxID=158456 RepID=A0A8M1HHH4_BETSP|nr:interferon-induced protein 44-like [Betta splendens]
MGQEQSLFKDPWRTLPESKEMFNFLKQYKPQNEQVTRLRILLHGPVGAGKSSFINSVDSVFQGRVAVRAPMDATSGESFTQKYKTYKIRKEPQSFYNFIFNDIMGFESDRGVQVEDVKLALMGHVKEGYRFNNCHQLNENDNSYNPDPTLDDRVHVLVCVVPVGSVSLLSDEVVKKMREVRLAASDLGIPQLAILTKPDEACPEVGKNVENLYKSIYLKEQVDKFSVMLGFPLNSIFLVKNYNSEINTNDGMNTHILSALKQIVMFGEDFLNDQ